MNLSMEREQLKELIKESVSEAFEQNREQFARLIGETLEDNGLAAAIREGETSEIVSRDEVFAALKHEG